MWHLIYGNYLDFRIVEDYLRFPRPPSRHVEIAPARMLRQDQNCIHGTEGIDHTTIIPFSHENDWAFAVTYSDCIAWYDSTPNSATGISINGGARPVMEGWSISQCKPHLSHGVADRLMQTFRARTFVELLYHKTEPNLTDLQDVNLEQVIEIGDLPSAMNQTSQGYTPAHRRAEPSIPEDGLFRTASAAQAVSSAPSVLCQAEEPAFSDGNLALPHTTAPDFPPELCSPQPQFPANTSRKRGLQPRAADETTEEPGYRYIDERIAILDNLPHAIHFSRSSLVSSKDDPFILWALLRYPRTSGNLHRRYHVALFHKMTEDNGRLREMKGAMGVEAEDRMKRDLQNWKFWKRVSDLGVEYGLGPFITLCAFEDDFNGYRLLEESVRDPLNETLKRRLQDESDMLHVRLQDARELCEAILVGKTPISLFKIDQYNFQSEFEMNDIQYKSYLRLDSIRGLTS